MLDIKTRKSDDMDINIGERIAYFRSAKGLTVNKLANLSGISQSYLRDIELGKNNNPTVELLDCICTTLDISLKDFFDLNTEIQFINDPLIKEIFQLSSSQRENLRIFLKSIRE